MKKLESLNSEKFGISESEMSQIKGGMVPAMSISSTYTEYDTNVAGGGQVCDTRHSDSCIDF